MKSDQVHVGRWLKIWLFKWQTEMVENYDNCPLLTLAVRIWVEAKTNQLRLIHNSWNPRIYLCREVVGFVLQTRCKEQIKHLYKMNKTVLRKQLKNRKITIYVSIHMILDSYDWINYHESMILLLYHYNIIFHN